jgi:hypothetical protein
MGCATSKDIENHGDDAPTRPSCAPAGSRAAAKTNASTSTNTTDNATATTTPRASKECRASSRAATPYTCSVFSTNKHQSITTVTTKTTPTDAEAAHSTERAPRDDAVPDEDDGDDVFIELVNTQLMGTDSSAVIETAPTSGRPTDGESGSLSHITPQGDKPSCRCLFRGNAVHLRCSRPDHAARTRAWVAESQTRYNSASSRSQKQPSAEAHRPKRCTSRQPKLPLAPHEEPLFDMLF